MATGNSDCASTSANLVRKHKAKSPAWDYFGLRVDLEGRVVKSTADQPVCKTCGKAVPSKGGSTTNLYTLWKTIILNYTMKLRLRYQRGPRLQLQ